MIQVHDKYGNLKTSLVGVGSGSVTSITAGTGMNFSTITTVGSISIHTGRVPYYAAGFTTGFAKWNGSAWIFDNSTYITASALSPYLLSTTAASTYYPIPTGLTTDYIRGDGSIAPFPTVSSAWGSITGTLSSQTDLINFLSATYYPISNPSGYINGISSGDVITALGYTPYDASNPSGYITSAALSPYLTSATASSTYYLQSNPSGYITSSALSPYLLSSVATTTYFPIPTGTTSQYIRGDGSLATFPSPITIDTNPTNGSANAVSSGGVFNALLDKLSLALGGIVAGFTKFTGGLEITTGLKYSTVNAALGKILTSDASGNATWQVPASLGRNVFYAKNVASDIGGYFVQERTVSIAITAPFVSSGVVDGQILVSFATPSGSPNLTSIPAGYWSFNINATQTSGTRIVQLYTEVYKRSSGGVETLLATSSNSDTVTGVAGDINTDFALTQVTLLATDRLVRKTRARVTGGGSAPTISLLVEDGTAARMEIPSQTVDSSNYVPYTGAVLDVDLGSKSLTASSLSNAGGTISSQLNLKLNTSAKATSTEINTGTDNAKYIVSDQLEASKYLNQNGTKLSSVASGTNTYTATLTPAIVSYTNTQRFFINFTNANTTTTPTLNLNSLGAKNIINSDGTAVAIGALKGIICLAYDGTSFQVVGVSYQAQIDSFFEKNILKEAAAWIIPHGLFNPQGSFGVSPNISPWGLSLSGNTGVGTVPSFARFNTTATAGTVAFRRGSFGIILGALSFSYTQKVRFETNLTGQRGVWGLNSQFTYSSPGNVEPTGFVNLVGVCQLSTSTNLHIIHNGSSGLATTFDLGSNYPCNTNIYTYLINIVRVISTVNYIITVTRITNSDNSTISTSYIASTKIPAVGVNDFSPFNYITNNGEASIATFFDGGCVAKLINY